MIYSRQYLPRKGTETPSLQIGLCYKHQIPDNIYPARGRKLAHHCFLQGETFQNSRQYLPRKGTETCQYFHAIVVSGGDIPDNIYPARGRKLS